MPWMKKDLMSLRGEFVHLVETELLPLATLCQRFGINRKTGYKWLARDRDEGRERRGVVEWEWSTNE